MTSLILVLRKCERGGSLKKYIEIQTAFKSLYADMLMRFAMFLYVR